MADNQQSPQQNANSILKGIGLVFFMGSAITLANETNFNVPDLFMSNFELEAPALDGDSLDSVLHQRRRPSIQLKRDSVQGDTSAPAMAIAQLTADKLFRITHATTSATPTYGINQCCL